MAVLSVCEALLPNLDPDVFSYIVGLLEDDESNDTEEMAETIAGFLLSAEFCDNDEEASAKAMELLDRLGRTSSGVAEKEKVLIVAEMAAKAAALSVQDNADTLASVLARMPQAPATKEDKPVESYELAETIKIEKQTSKAAAREEKKLLKNTRGKKKGKLTLSEQAEAQALEIDAELHAARVAAVKARTKLGAYKGALDAASFTLPNPGGGTPLLEDAACTLVFGRKYGLIGRNGTGKSTVSLVMRCEFYYYYM
jgi:ATP-binding cassette, subfamily F, member 3